MRISQKFLIPFLITLVVASLWAVVARANPSVESQLARVREVSARYHDVSVAVADGYVPTDHCIPGMGYHFANPALIEDPALDPLQPELVIYADSGNGLRLVAVEYLVFDTGQPHPELFGTRFDGPMEGHEPGMPVHYDLHAWVWSDNPDGVLTAVNPRIEC